MHACNMYDYETIQWETGSASGGSGGLGGVSASVGYTAGNGGPAYSMPGSLVPGSFLDGGPHALVSSSTAGQPPGRYVFEVRGSIPDV